MPKKKKKIATIPLSKLVEDYQDEILRAAKKLYMGWVDNIESCVLTILETEEVWNPHTEEQDLRKLSKQLPKGSKPREMCDKMLDSMDEYQQQLEAVRQTIKEAAIKNRKELRKHVKLV